MSATRKPARLTVDLADEELYRAIQMVASDRRQPVREIVVEALREWLRNQEEQEDLDAIRAAREGPTIPWEEVKAEIRAAEARESVE